LLLQRYFNHQTKKRANFISREKVWELRPKTYTINYSEGYNVLLGYPFVKKQDWLHRLSKPFNSRFHNVSLAALTASSNGKVVMHKRILL
jgi:hypothetical protein